MKVEGEHAAVPVTAYIGLGSNLDGPKQQVAHALRELDGLPLTRLVAASALYRTAPVGPQDQPDYVNAVAELTTKLQPCALLAALQAIEEHHGRIRNGMRWGPRPLDLDILLFGQERIDLPRLRVPHRELTRRVFVLIPLADVAPRNLVIPGIGTLGQCLAARREIGRSMCRLAGSPTELT